MDIRPVLALLGLLAATGVLAQAYTWTDEDGVVHYSDRPQPGARRVELQAPNSSRSPSRSSAQESSDGDGAEEPAAPFRYESLEVANPGPEETLWNIEGTLSVTLALTPALRPGHQVRVYFDGNPRLVNSTTFQIDEVWRGVHNLQAEVLDETGNMMIRSRTNRFYVQQNTVF